MSDILVGSGNQGDFVHQNQVMASKQGFKNVSKLWYDKTQSYEEGMDLIAQREAAREDIKANTKAMQPYFNEDTGDVGLEYEDGRQFHLTPHAWRQLATRCDVPHTFINVMLETTVKKPGFDYKRDRNDNFALYTVIRNGFRRMKQNSNYLFRVYNDSNICRAVLTEKYAIIDNEWYMNQIKSVIPDGRLSHFNYSTGDSIYGNVLIPDSIREEDDSDYGGMLSISNCEIGIRTMSQYPSVFRAICMNGCIWDRTSGKAMRQVHLGKIDLIDLSKRIRENLTSQIPLLSKGVDTFLQTREWKLDNVSLQQLFVQIASDNNLNVRQADQLFREFGQHEKNQRNAFGVVNAITRAGQQFDADDWYKLDCIAGDIVTSGANGWERLSSRARTISDKDVEKFFAKDKTLELVA